MGHICRCMRCSPGDFPSGPRMSPEHIAVRFDRGWKEGQPWWCAAIDGEYVHDLIEALPGSDGYVVLNAFDERGKCHVCKSCGEGVCIDMRRGRVVTWLMPWEAWTADRSLRAERARELMP